MKLLDLLLKPWRAWKQRRAKRKFIEEMRKRDPFIY
jgi:RNase P/RNase MRP subunit p30